jgi:hypothetical protein
MCLLLLFALSTVAAINPDPSVTILVTDELGAVIPNAVVWIHQDPTTVFNLKTPKLDDLSGRTDNEGKITWRLGPGFYDVFVTATAFSPACRKLRVRAAAQVSVPFKLKVDPIVSEEIGGVLVH